MPALRRSPAAALAAAILMFALGPPAGAAEPLSPEQKAAVQAIVRDYIVQHPEVVLDALRAMEARQKADEEKAALAALAEHRQALERSDGDPVLGNPDGDVTIVEFFDYQCGYCKSMTGPLLDLVKADGRIRLVLKEFPILGPESVVAAKASLASLRQGGYEALHKTLMGLRGRLSEPAIWQAAAEAGLDVAKLRKDMADPAIEASIHANYELAQALRIEGTPAFAIGRSLVPGAAPKEHLAELVRRVREGRG